VRARLERQTVLNDATRRFFFVLTEQAARWKYVNRSVMAEQCNHMAELSERKNIDIAVIPRSAEVPGGALNSFVIYDDRLVLAETFSGEVELRDPKDIAHHVNLFEFFRAKLCHGPSTGRRRAHQECPGQKRAMVPLRADESAQRRHP
jgi:hypothetical protein